MRPGLNAPSAGPWRGPGEHAERFAQQALGHNSKAVHHAYSKHAEVSVPSLDDWEKQWKRKTEGSDQKSVISDRNEMPKPAVVQVDFKVQQASEASEEAVGAVAGVGQG